MTQISKKAITLLALITVHSTQTFSLIKIANIEKIGNGRLLIKIPVPIKTSRKNRQQLILKIPLYQENVKIDGLERQCLQQALTLTHSRRILQAMPLHQKLNDAMLT